MRRIGIILSALCLTLVACNNSNDIHDASGTFEATEVILSAEANGKLIEFNVHEAQKVSEGDVIGYIDSIQLYLKREQLKANIVALKSKAPSVRVQLSVLYQQLRTANFEKQRLENLIRDGAANKKMLDDINANISLLEKQIEAQKSTLNISIASIRSQCKALDWQIAQLNNQIEKCKIEIPISGTVLVKYAEQSELTAVGKPLVKVADLETVILRAYLTANQLSDLKLGDKLPVFADYGEGEERKYEGAIEWISNKAEFTPKTIQTKDERANLVYAVKLSVKNDGLIKLGMYASIDIK